MLRLRINISDVLVSMYSAAPPVPSLATRLVKKQKKHYITSILKNWIISGAARIKHLIGPLPSLLGTCDRVLLAVQEKSSLIDLCDEKHSFSQTKSSPVYPPLK